VHMLTKEASNALLKTLEEPPPYVIFVLATTEGHKVLPTIMSRCQRFDFRRVAQTDVVAKLTSICTAEGFQIEPEALRLIARTATGSLRDAENLLQQLSTYYGGQIELAQVQAMLGITGDNRVKELARHIATGNVTAGITTINSIDSDGLDLRQFNRELMEYFRLLLLIKTGSGETIDLTTEDIDELKDIAAGFSLPQIVNTVKLFARIELSLDTYSTLPLEMALVEATFPRDDTKTDAVTEPGTAAMKAAPAVKPAPPKRPADKRPPEPETTPEPAPAGKPEPAAVSEEPASEPAESATANESEIAEPAAEIEPEPKQSEKSAAASAAPPAANNEIERLRQNWKQFINESPSDIGRTPAAALLRSARPKSLEDNVVVISFKYPLHKINMEKPENHKIAEKIISNFLGYTCGVRCIHEPESNHLVDAALKIGGEITDVEEK